jgi:hypothetical protein
VDKEKTLLVAAPKPGIIGMPIYDQRLDHPSGVLYTDFQTTAKEAEVVSAVTQYLARNDYRFLGRGLFMNPGSYFFQSHRQATIACFVIDYYPEQISPGRFSVAYWTWDYHPEPDGNQGGTPTCDESDIKH